MKHPREILFERHRSATPQLDAIRKNVLTTLSTSTALETQSLNPPSFIRSALRDMLRPFRWHLAGLSAAWGLILFLNADPTHTQSQRTASKASPPSRQLLSALREHRRQIVELLESPGSPSEPRPQPSQPLPKRRSERPSHHATA